MHAPSLEVRFTYALAICAPRFSTLRHICEDTYLSVNMLTYKNN